MRKPSTIWLFAIIVFVIPVALFAGINWYEKRLGTLPVMGPVKEQAGKTIYHTIADFKFMNQDGKHVSASAWEDKIIVADFFFTHCPVICPTMTNNLKKVQEAFKNDEDLVINSFTVDPARDSVGQLKWYSGRFGIDNSNWQLLTGDKRELYKLARNSFLIVATDGDGGPEDFIHSEKLVLVDKQRRIRGYYQGTNSKEVEQLIIDIKKLKNEN
jgi:protein SCO1/2